MDIEKVIGKAEESGFIMFDKNGESGKISGRDNVAVLASINDDIVNAAVYIEY